MYIPKPFEITDRRAMHEIIEANGFGILVSAGGELIATHLPFLLHPNEGKHGTLYAHIARPNQHRTFFGSAALAIFMGPHGYVSPTWYSDPTTNVPTWNYVAVHAYGVPQELPEAEAAPHLARLVAKYESHGWSMNDLKPSLRDTMPKGVAAFRIAITRLEGKAKLSQNKTVAERVRVMEQFRASGESALADAMKQYVENVS
jgi:transcriptional regulator